MHRAALLAAVFAAVALVGPSAAQACSRDDSVFYETFIDTTCLQLPLTNTTLDAQGGLRLTTNGVPSVTPWDSNTDFDNGITHQSVLFPPVGVGTLVRNGTGAAATLGLPTTLLPLSLDAANPVLRPAAATVLDSDNVDDPALAKVGSTYVMWYSGTSEDGGKPAIFIATSSDGVTWARANGGAPVMQGTPAAFDGDGVYGPDVVYDPADPVAPYRMWYSGRSGVFGAIGYATSLDGVTWVKYPSYGPLPLPVLTHGPAGSADSFSAADPTVLKDGSTWKMWYTGDDSSKKRVAYATSSDGINWAKGGKVIAPEDSGVSANIAFGAFAPTVWKTATGYSMLLTGRKLVGGGVFQTKIMGSSSSDGIAWSGPSPALNPSGSSTNFDYSNLNSPELLQDPGAGTPYKLYYSGNTIDANGNFHTRIGLATSNDGNSFSKVNGSHTGGSVLDVGALGTAFDGRQASGLAAVAPAGAAPKLAGFYWGTRGSDFKPRLGEATSADGTAWTKVPVSGANGGALFGLGNPAAFDNGGQRDPSPLDDAGAYYVYFTGLDSGGTGSIGYASTPEDAVTKQPNNGSWSARSQLLAGDGTGFDASAVAHPSVIKDGANYIMYYTGLDSGGTAKIGRATATAATGPFTRGANAVLDLGAASEFDASSVKDPVVIKAGAGDYRMLYTGVETLEGKTIERAGYANSADGITWTKRGVVLDPSLNAYAADETGVEPTGMLIDGSTLHVWTSGVDRTGRTRGDHATTAYPTPGSPQPGIPTGWATYQLGDSSTSVRDFRQLVRTSSGTSVALWLSFLQPYSSGGNDFWSEYFPVTVSNPSEALNFLLTVRGVRWQARLSNPGGAPLLDKVELTHAPVSFSPAGSGSSTSIGPSAGRIVTAWRSFTATMTLFSPNGGGSGSGSARLLDATSGEQVATVPLNTGDTTLDLSGVAVAAHQSLRVVFDLQSADGQATPRVQAFKVLFDSAVAPPPPPVLTLAASPKTIVFGKAVTLSGTVTRSGVPVAGQAVALGAQPIGAKVFSSLPAATTDAAGNYRAVIKPTKRTTYKAGFTGVSPEPTAVVAVKHSITLRASRRSGKVYLRGTVGPRHPRRVVLIQRLKGKRWITIARVRTSRKSTFQLVRKASRTRTRFRARIGADSEHLGNTSRVVRA
ncbi:MAG: hypothetical protein E6G45_10045 [Actinobacteria bacterium]|nr:MAG: hypothetical protein E6G45_10045 [Actinomycetota bacterium]